METQHLDMPISLENLAILYADQEKYAKGEPLLKRVLTNYRQQFGANHPAIAGIHNNLAILNQNQREYPKAEPLNQSAPLSVSSIWDRTIL
jgi:Tetratricopeptide repeat